MSSKILAALFNRPGKKRNRVHRRRRLLEPLESRTVLTTLSVNGSAAGCATEGDALYCEVQSAIDDADPGDTIAIHAGTYAAFVINKNNLTVREATANANPIIDGTNAANAVELSANGVTIIGLEAQNAALAQGNGFYVSGDNNTLVGNVARGNHGAGFALRFADNNTLSGNLASGNKVWGFHLFGSNGNTLQDNVSEDTLCLDGFALIASHNNTLVGNTSTGSGDHGVWLSDSGSNTLTRNVSSGNGVHGFVVNGQSDNNEFRLNIAEGNVEDGFLFDRGSQNSVHENTAIGNGANGFCLGNALAHTTLKHNLSHNNGFSGFALGELSYDLKYDITNGVLGNAHFSFFALARPAAP